MSEKQYPDWWIKEMEDTFGKDNEWLNYIKKHDKLPPGEEPLKPLREIEDLEELAEDELHRRMSETMEELEWLIDEYRRRLNAVQIRLKKLMEKKK